MECRNLRFLSISLTPDFKKSENIWYQSSALRSFLDRQVIRKAIEVSANSNTNLKSLRLEVDAMFNENFSFNIKLKEFASCNLPEKPDALMNLDRFLMSQKETLEVLTITHSVDAAILETILSMPRLKKLYMKVDNDNLKLAASYFEPNYSVTKLSLPYFMTEHLPIKLIFKFFPMVDYLKVADKFLPEQSIWLRKMY